VTTLAQVAATTPRERYTSEDDVEGEEAGAVLEGADFDTYRPWILLLEATCPKTRS